MSHSARVAAVFAAFAAVLLGAAGWLAARDAGARAQEELARRLQAFAAAGALAFDGDAVAALRGKADMAKPSYAALKRRLAALRREGAPLRVAGAVLLRSTGKRDAWEYVADGDSSQEAYALGHPFDAKDWPELKAAYNGPTRDAALRRDPYGVYLSGYAPVLDSKGQATSVLEVWAYAEEAAAVRARALRGLVPALVLGLLLCVPAGLLAGRLLSRRVSALTVAAEAVGRGELGARVEEGPDELGRLGAAFNQMTRGLRERDLIKDAFSKYVSREVAEKVMSQPLDQVLGGERRRVSVLFTDVRRFTEMSETLRPEEVLAALNEHFSMLIDVLFEYEGTLDKFLGDGLMAIFGAPVTHPDDAERAVRAALRMQERLAEHNARQRAAGKPALEIGIGVNTGTAVAGNIGSAKRKEYSVIGDTVNVAARLQAIAPAGAIYVSGATREELKDLLDAEKLPPQALKGKAGAVEVWRVKSLGRP